MREDLREELKELLAYVEAQNTRIKALDRQLDPYWPRARSLKQAVLKTHHWIGGTRAKAIDWRLDPAQDVVVGWCREGACQRAGLFAELDRLALVYGPIREQRRVAKLEAEAAQRAADRIRERLAKPAKSNRQRPPETDDLFTNH